MTERGHHIWWKWGVCCRAAWGMGNGTGGSVGSRGKGRGGSSLGFLFPKFPAPVYRAGTQSLPWKFLETGGGMKRSHWWLTDLSPWTPSPFLTPSHSANQHYQFVYSPPNLFSIFWPGPLVLARLHAADCYIPRPEMSLITLLSFIRQ